MSAPIRVQRRRTKGWRMPAGAVNVTRGTDWGNPFRVGDWIGQGTGPIQRAEFEITPRLAVVLFEAWVTDQGWLEQIRHELAGKDLVCWCPLDRPCHADVLLRLANA